MATHSSTLAWKIPWTEEPGRLQSMGSQRVRLELSCFFDDPVDVGNLISGSSVFSKSSLYIWNFLVYVVLKTSLKDLSIIL